MMVTVPPVMVMVPTMMVVPHMMMVTMAAHMAMMVMTVPHLHERVREADRVG